MSITPIHATGHQAFPTYAPGGTFQVESLDISLADPANMSSARIQMAQDMQRILNTAAQAGGETTILPIILTREVAGWGGLFFVTHFSPNTEASDTPASVVTEPPEYGEV